MKYKIHPDKAIADIAIEAFGKDLNELFENSAFAVFEESCDLKTVKEKETKEISLSADSIEDLLFDFLSETLYIKDTDSFIFKNSKVAITEKNKKYHLKATLSGEPIDRERNKLNNDIKAITLHMFKVEKLKNSWKCFFVVDV